MFDQKAVERSARIADVCQRARGADPVASAAATARDTLKAPIVNPDPVSGQSGYEGVGG